MFSVIKYVCEMTVKVYDLRLHTCMSDVCLLKNVLDMAGASPQTFLCYSLS